MPMNGESGVFLDLYQPSSSGVLVHEWFQELVLGEVPTIVLWLHLWTIQYIITEHNNDVANCRALLGEVLPFWLPENWLVITGIEG